LATTGTQIADATTGWRPAAIAVVAGLATLRFAVAYWSALTAWRGDFYATLPGAYVERINPALWNSPDLSDSWAFHQRVYLHGPTQFLTLYPIGYLKSYAAIASVLLPIYAVLVLGAVVLLARTVRTFAHGGVSFWSVYAIVCSFFPLLQALGQREFEIVIVAALAIAAWAIVSSRPVLLGAAAAYITAFKYIPVMVAAYFLARRWWRVLLAYAAGLAVLVLAAQLTFGLRGFLNGTVADRAAEQFSTVGSHDAFCAAFVTPASHNFARSNQTFAGLRWGLCSINDRHPWLPLPVSYWALCAAIAAAAIAGFLRLERVGALDPDTERVRRLLELSIVVTVYSTAFFTHYYYLSALVLPLVVLFARIGGAWPRRRVAMALWAAAYLLLGAFVVPSGIVARLTGIDLFAVYMSRAVYVYGEILLFALLLREYMTLPLMARVPSR
jgi:Glycosyltransferase family 87